MAKKAKIWVVDDDDSIRWVLDKALSKAGFNTEIFNSADDALEHLGQQPAGCHHFRYSHAGYQRSALLDNVKKKHPEIPVIIMTAHY